MLLVARKYAAEVGVTMSFVSLGALLTIVGLLYLVKQVIWQGPLSGPVRRRSPATLEPRVGVFGFARYWPGLALMALGGLFS